MASFDGLQLWREDFRAGALLPLRAAPKTSGRHVGSDGVEVETRAKVRDVAVRNLVVTDPTKILSVATREANLALDFMCSSAIAPLSLGDLDEFNLTWWTAGPQRIIRLSALTILQSRALIGGFFHEPGDPGNQFMRTTSNQWHPCLRYFRLSQSTDDLLDGFRNLYLAVESILDMIHPKTGWGREKDWLEAALQHAGGLVNLDEFARPGAGSARSRLLQEIWTDVRNAVFHAKVSQGPFLPLDPAHRKQVIEAHLRIGALFLALAANQLGVRFLSSGLSDDGAAVMGTAVMDGLQMFISDDDSPTGPSDTVIVSEGRSFVSTEAPRAPEFDGSRRFAVRGTIPVAEVMAAVPRMARVTIARAGQRFGWTQLEGPLTLDGADSFEVVFSAGIASVELRSSYPS